MSIANENIQSNLDGNEYFVNDNENVNDTDSGTCVIAETLHDPTIEGTNKNTVCRTEAVKNDELNGNEENVNVNETDSNQSIDKTMTIYYGWQAFCLLIIVFTVYETYQNVLPKDLKYPEPKRFFNNKSPVRDYPHGNLISLQKKVSLADVALVMFYAPWSAESQHARPVYEATARLFQHEVEFSAINCWQPGGECRQKYTKVMAYPVLMAYNRNNVAISYNGQWNEPALSRFTYLLLNPMRRISRPEHLLAIIHDHDAVVVLFVNMDTSKQFYNIFYQTALKWLENDPYGDVAFAVVTGEASQNFGVDREPSLRLYLWNGTVEYENSLWKPSLLHKWLLGNMRQITYWLTPPGSRSKEIDLFLQKGPALLLFTPRNLYQSSSDAYAMLRQIGYEYNNCENDTWLKEMARDYIFNQRKHSLKDYYLRTKECSKIFDWRNHIPNKCAPLDKHAFIGLANSSKFHYNTANKIKASTEYCQKPTEPPKSGQTENFHEKCSKNFPHEKHETSMLDNENDPLSAENIFNVWKTINCRMNHLSRELRVSMFFDPLLETPKNSGGIDFNKITGLGCRTNKTLTIMAMDSFTYGLIAEKLGISLKTSVQNTVAVLIDAQDETSYVLKEPVTTSNLIDFVYNFTTNKLDRHLRNDDTSNHSHYYNPVDTHSSKNYHPQRVFESITLPTISSANFTDFIWEKNKMAAILFTSTQCAFCTIFSSTLLGVMQILKNENYLKFARIDADRNDLPWQFTMETLPAFVIFNGDNQLESRKFPSSMEINVPNILGFILSNLNRPNRLRAMSSLLNSRAQQRQSFETTVVVMQREIEDAIVENLKLWRRLPLKRAYILRRIQALHRLYLELFRQTDRPDLDKLNALIQDVLNVWLFNT